MWSFNWNAVLEVSSIPATRRRTYVRATFDEHSGGLFVAYRCISTIGFTTSGDVVDLEEIERKYCTGGRHHKKTKNNFLVRYFASDNIV